MHLLESPQLLKRGFPLPLSPFRIDSRNRSTPLFSASNGFSLPELVSVIAIVLVLISISPPILRILNAAKTVSKGAHELTSLFECARNEAMARQTYVWVGLLTDKSSRSTEVLAGAVASLDGSGVNTDPSNLRPLSKIVHIPNAQLIPREELTKPVQEMFPRPTESVSNNAAGLTFSIAQVNFPGTTLTFTPGGEVLLAKAPGPMDGYKRGIDVGLRETAAGATPVNPQEAALFLDGAHGGVQTFKVE